MDTGNLFSGISLNPEQAEQFDLLLKRSGVRLERIVSLGHTTADGQWYDQESDEWVVLLSGRASLRIEDETEDRVLAPGDWLFLPAGCRHRVNATAANEHSVWLALHLDPVQLSPGA